jgi:GNAT superfamily N-acetyltransferase
MILSLQPATDKDAAFCESLNRQNMANYLTARNITWDSNRFLSSWKEFENFMIYSDAQAVGLLRLLPEENALGIRDLQIVPEYQNQGIGSWAIQQAKDMAIRRGYPRLQLRVYEDNPAKDLYERLGFEAVQVVDSTVYMQLLC